MHRVHCYCLGTIQRLTEVASDLMLRSPKTLAADASVAEVREQLANPKVQMVLLADGHAFKGAVTRVPDDAAPNDPALTYSDERPTRSRPTRRPTRHSNAQPPAPTGV